MRTGTRNVRAKRRRAYLGWHPTQETREMIAELKVGNRMTSRPQTSLDRSSCSPSADNRPPVPSSLRLRLLGQEISRHKASLFSVFLQSASFPAVSPFRSHSSLFSLPFMKLLACHLFCALPLVAQDTKTEVLERGPQHKRLRVTQTLVDALGAVTEETEDIDRANRLVTRQRKLPTSSLYSAAVSLLLARRASAASHNSFSSWRIWSWVIDFT